MARRFALAALSGLLLVGLAAAARQPSPDWLRPFWTEEQGPMGAFTGGGAFPPTPVRSPGSQPANPFAVDSGGGEHKGDAILAVRYYVAPEHHRHFIDAWRKLEDAVAQRKGNCVFDLKKTADDDFAFLGYGEWSSLRDLDDHAHSKEAEEFVYRLQEMDVAWAVQPLYTPSDAGELARGPRANRCKPSPDGADAGRGKHGRMAHVLVRYWGPPSAHQDLVKAWGDALEGVRKEGGSRIFSLRKTLNDNVQWYSYGTWDSMDDVQRHFESDHVQKLRDRLGELRVYWRLTMLHKIGDQPE
ncbi:hypothetical protein Rsub_04103 [Raphidocelis subcapitata]|uniref:ABM domain-containing protein n=1 Tax=Raphidocelis subcapitata TaxID=307507 RepID=A0A2V0P0J1_9CHLO|nr:hypothetical protein Rsub_04103 [Raphidocelis subcapitata]|eukprot:GBF91363.1 hypothetical protein Rsub_04103 [Raphidocelis subcapitata]